LCFFFWIEAVELVESEKRFLEKYKTANFSIGSTAIFALGIVLLFFIL
jgi:hypothetical protein